MNNRKTKYLICIAGPTAVGKTSLCVELAKTYDTEIINADSRQIYKELNIGVAKPTKDEMDSIKHHFIDHLSIEEEYAAGKYEKEAIPKIDKLFLKKDILILSGGTGLYLNAVIYGFDELPEIPKNIFDDLEQEYKMNGLSLLLSELKQKDPSFYDQVDRHNHRRVIRALAHIRHTQTKFSDKRKAKPKSRNFKTIGLILKRDRDELYTRINKRVDQMIEEGLLKEAKNLYSKKDLKALQTVGYNELFDYLDGKQDYEKAISMIKQNSRRYAKRQMTWNRKYNWPSFHPENVQAILNYINTSINE